MSIVHELAQAALRGFFGDEDGFKNMDQDASRKAAAREVRKVLTRYFAWWAEPVAKRASVIVPLTTANVPSDHNPMFQIRASGKKESS